MKDLRDISLSHSENKIKEVNDALNIVKDYLKKFNTNYNKEKKYNFIIEIERIIQQLREMRLKMMIKSIILKK